MATKDKRSKRETGKLVVLNEEELIRQVELRPILYDKSLKGYRKSALRYQYWKEVGDVVGAKVEECRRRWRSLRDAFSKHYKYLNRAEDATQNKRKKWVFYDQMSFIAPFLDNSYCEIEDTLLEDFPDNSDDDHTLMMHATNNENCPMPELETIVDGDATHHHLEVDEKLCVSGSPNGTGALSDEHQFIASMLQVAASTSPTGLMQSQAQEENSKNDKPQMLTCGHVEHLHASTSSSSSVAMCLDGDEKFLMSCAPILRRLSHRKNALARLKIQQILYDIEFELEDR